tara:strand:+ start:530 stop:928 length:399 start_codon:yes stop_codon:yes gene_type:complete
MSGIGPELPLHRDGKNGTYSLITSYKSEVQQNFKNLLLTSPGEKMMNPDFGVGLRRFLFDPREQAIPQIRQRIESQISKYLPYIRVKEIDFNSGNQESSDRDETHTLSIKIIYDVPSMGINTFIILEREDIN